MEPHLSGPHLSGLFTYPDICLRTNSHSSTESASLIRKFSYRDSHSGNGVVGISEAPLYTTLVHTIREKVTHRKNCTVSASVFTSKKSLVSVKINKTKC